jgi:hypothetical protein
MDRVVASIGITGHGGRIKKLVIIRIDEKVFQSIIVDPLAVFRILLNEVAYGLGWGSTMRSRGIAWFVVRFSALKRRET